MITAVHTLAKSSFLKKLHCFSSPSLLAADCREELSKQKGLFSKSQFSPLRLKSTESHAPHAR